ncbi:hypothetical protein D0C16_12495 [Cellvibrio sp. KY-GH-1]|uniref:hypothetical protein n=1 Tax=Cellvibrio sp. KY-GH-1 TaxID=2303332 RepID=UPI0012483992|nr:hypothetical protein [Cellvibrio sp. KY-GH-1]QEY16714.1 hypothetical protein D0C16_12495 [Cellvibrio sp. KY-GH-1]
MKSTGSKTPAKKGDGKNSGNKGMSSGDITKLGLGAAQGVVELGSNLTSLLNEKEKTKQVYIEANKTVKISEHELEKSGNELKKAIKVEDTKLQELANEMKVNESSHDQWTMDFEERAKTMAEIRIKVANGTVTPAELELLNNLHMK